MAKDIKPSNARTELKAWIGEVRPKHSQLTESIVALLRNLLKTHSIDFLSVDGRTKSEKSILEKCNRKSYIDPKQQLTDISGIRIVTFLESQVNEIIDLIKNNFEIDHENSMDRATVLGSDKIGYRSVHYVCSLNSSRTTLPEYTGLDELRFELQVRTVLQHAWAELAHDRSFKLGLELPKSIQRKLNLHAGMLEIVDAAFDEIAKEIDAYRASFKNARLDEMLDADINSISLEKFTKGISKTYNIKLAKIKISTEVIDELRSFGIETIGDLIEIATPATMLEIRRTSTTAMGLLRDIMMMTDLDRYFSKKPDWGVAESDSVAGIVRKYGAQRVADCLYKHDIFLRIDEDHWVSECDEIRSLLERYEKSKPA